MKKQLRGQESLFEDHSTVSVSDTGVHDKQRLKELQALPLDRKIMITQTRIIEWYFKWKGQVYVSFSGGKDSTVLLHIARQCFPDIEAVFVNTGLEYPEIQKFAKSFENVTVVRPDMSFVEVIKHYGYPMISKEVAECLYDGKLSLLRGGDAYSYRLKKLRGEVVDKCGNPSIYNCPKYEPLLHTDFYIGNRCCGVMKKSPAKNFEKRTEKKAIIATMAQESKIRRQAWLTHGCNAFAAKRPTSQPMSFWTENDVLEYLYTYSVPYAPVYGEIVRDGGGWRTTGERRTGCVFCAFGAHLEKSPNRFQRLKLSHPKLWDYCMRPWSEHGLGMREVLEYIGIQCE